MMVKRTYTEVEPSERTFPKLSARLRDELFEIPSSQYYRLQMWPCAVTSICGTVSQNVLVAEAASYLEHWGAWPDELRGATASLKADDVQSIAESPNRLPAFFANRVYTAGETSMGSHEFAVIFSDGTKYAYKAGGCVDFVLLPEGKSMVDLVDVSPGDTGNCDGEGELPFYTWCLFSL